ncbi:glycerol-3-phosphate 1-O-acyltransferase PlsY [Methylotetracoccus oryzae]|uniref:glycerol-3-phosphate 1-O-acyltransferase PlsY n=1 Tax=Methylotetracoccus oryzae TaxID=1919059 RepID=UPI001119D3DA|nr:glycerol-3-phosphate 1-O-acyltransferase PlsY [Methylotetracoccus oryzae]
MINWFLVPLAYLLGSVSTAVIVSRIAGLPDPREQGSKNPGATNVLRLGGKKAAVITLLGDAAKGLMPVLIAKGVGAEPIVIAATGLAAFLGHLFPVFFGFKGGKGVATALGVLLGYSSWVGLAAAVTWLGMAAAFRISSLSALVASLLAPTYSWFLVRSPELTVATATMSALLIVRHRANIQRLLRGEEGRIGR